MFRQSLIFLASLAVNIFWNFFLNCRIFAFYIVKYNGSNSYHSIILSHNNQRLSLCSLWHRQKKGQETQVQNS